MFEGEVLTGPMIGNIGIILYGSLLLVSVWRTYKHFVPYLPPIYSNKKLFHIVILLYSMVQIVAFSSFVVTGDYTKWGYGFHLMAIFFEVSGFSLVAVLWSQTLLSKQNAQRRLIPFLFVVDLLVLIFLVTLIVDMITFDGDMGNWALNSKILTYLMIVEPSALFINGMIVLYLGIRIRTRLLSHPHFRILDERQKRLILCRLLGTMSACCICFFVRAGLELYLYIDQAKLISYDMWWIFSNWVPSILPISLLLYTMRRTDNSTAKRRSSDICKNKNKNNLRLDSDNDSFNNRYSNDTNILGESGSDNSLIVDDYTLNSPLINNNQERNSKTSNHSIDKGNFYRGAPTTGFRTATLTDWDDDDNDIDDFQFEDEVIVYR